MLEKICFYTDTIILYGKLVTGIGMERAGKLADVKVDGAALRSVFHSVTQDIYENLAKLGRITLDTLMQDFILINGKSLLLLDCLRTDKHFNLLNLFGEVEGFRMQMGLSAFDFAHVEDIIDDSKHILAGRLNLAGIFFRFCRVVGGVQKEAGDSHNGVIGVRMSWDILDRKALLIWLAVLAA